MQITRITIHSQIWRAAKGFTLIEVMIVVAIIGILAAIGYPSYGKYAQKTRRSDGHVALLQAVQSLERCKATDYSYTNCVLPDDLTTSPEGYYSITLEKTSNTYTVTATGEESQADDTDCTPMTLDNQGTRTPADAEKKCWPK